MKSLFLVISCGLALAATAQRHISINQQITDDGKTMTISIAGISEQKPINYKRTFDVAGMSPAEKDALKARVYDSLGLPLPVAPNAALEPHAPARLVNAAMAPIEPLAPLAPMPPTLLMSTSPYQHTYAIGGTHPYTKEVKYNPGTGMLTLKYRFIKKGKEVAAEKTIDAAGNSQEQRDQIIRSYEKEIGLVPPEII